MHWLDAARYADTNGYNNDEDRVDVALARLGDRRLQPRTCPTISSSSSSSPATCCPMRDASTQQSRHRLQPQSRAHDRRAASSKRSTASSTSPTASTRRPPSSSACRCNAPAATTTSTTRSRSATTIASSPSSTTCRTRVVGYSQGRMAEPLLEGADSPSSRPSSRGWSAGEASWTAASAHARPRRSTPAVAAWEAGACRPTDRCAGRAGWAWSPTSRSMRRQATGWPMPSTRLALGTIRGKALDVAGKIGERPGIRRPDVRRARARSARSTRDQKFSLAAWIYPTVERAGDRPLEDGRWQRLSRLRPDPRRRQGRQPLRPSLARQRASRSSRRAAVAERVAPRRRRPTTARARRRGVQHLRRRPAAGAGRDDQQHAGRHAQDRQAVPHRQAASIGPLQGQDRRRADCIAEL